MLKTVKDIFQLSNVLCFRKTQKDRNISVLTTYLGPTQGTDYEYETLLSRKL